MGGNFQVEFQVSGLPGHVEPTQAALERSPGWDDPIGTFSPIGPPGKAASNIPFYGSGRNFVNEAQHGNFGGTLFYGAMFATDFGSLKSGFRAATSMATGAIRWAWRWGVRKFGPASSTRLIGGATRGAAQWGNPKTLARHFRDHGADFGARNADEYAGLADNFFGQAQRGGLPTKIGPDGTIRAYDPATNTFGSFHPDGTTKTFFKPDPSVHGYPTNLDYWNAQPGAPPWTP